MKSLMVIAAATALFGCGDLLAFPVEASVDEFVVPGDPYLHHDETVLADDVVPPVEVALDVPVGQGSISLVGFTLALTATSTPEGDQDDLEFLDAVDVHLASTAPGSVLPVILVAQWDRSMGKLASDTEVELGVAGDTNISPYLSEGFRLDIRPRGVVPYDDVSFVGAVRFLVSPL